MPQIGLGGFLRGIKGSIAGAAILVAWDAGLEGSFLLSVLVCPVWLLVSFVHNAVKRPDWRVALARVAMPVVVFCLVKANSDYQNAVAEANARRIIVACEAYRTANGQLPEKLNDLVPQYFASVPPAKHCLTGRFVYSSSVALLWWQVAGFYRKTYSFETRTWGHVD